MDQHWGQKLFCELGIAEELLSLFHLKDIRRFAVGGLWGSDLPRNSRLKRSSLIVVADNCFHKIFNGRLHVFLLVEKQMKGNE